MRLKFGIRLEIEYQHVLTTKTLAAGIDKLARAEKDLNTRLIFVLALPFFPGFFLFGFLFGLALLVFVDALPNTLVFLF